MIIKSGQASPVSEEFIMRTEMLLLTNLSGITKWLLAIVPTIN